MRGAGYDIGRGGFGDEYGNSYVVGHFTSSPLDVNGINLTCNGSANGILAKYDPTGELIWVRQALSTGIVAPFGAAFDGNNIIHVGRYYNDANFGDGLILTNPGAFWSYVVKIGQQ